MSRSVTKMLQNVADLVNKRGWGHPNGQSKIIRTGQRVVAPIGVARIVSGPVCREDARLSSSGGLHVWGAVWPLRPICLVGVGPADWWGLDSGVATR